MNSDAGAPDNLSSEEGDEGGLLPGLADRLREVRLNTGLSQSETADRLGLSIKGYTNYENGLRNPPTSTVVRFCDVFGTSLSWLVYGEASPEIEKTADLVGRAVEVVYSEAERRKISSGDVKIASIAGFLCGSCLRNDTLPEHEVGYVFDLVYAGVRKKRGKTSQARPPAVRAG